MSNQEPRNEHRLSDEDWFVCAHCGAVLVGDPTNCPRCGADEETGWSPTRDEDGVDLDDEFDYEDFLAEEFGPGAARANRSPWVILVILAMIVAFVAILVLH
jgi:hypothetical protein